MLVVQCANGWVAWIFRSTDPQHKIAMCLADGFQIAYDPSPTTAWIDLVVAIIAHSQSLKGAVQTTHWMQP